MAPSIHPQDVANLILHLQTELALLEQDRGLSPDNQARLRHCQEILRQSIDQMHVRGWYQELTYGLREQLGRLEEWL
ncbi:MAG: hypothetical protein OHK0012_08290 [Synechococcales cyanobacterium]